MHYKLALQGSVFSTRPRAVSMLQDLQGQLATAPSHETLVLDFAGVRHVSFSFADEFVGTLVQRAHDDAVAPVRVENTSPAVHHAIMLGLVARELPHALDPDISPAAA